MTPGATSPCAATWTCCQPCSRPRGCPRLRGCPDAPSSGRPNRRRPATSVSLGRSPALGAALRRDSRDEKFIDLPIPELYDLRRPAGEGEPVRGASETARSLARALPALRPAAPAAESAETVRRLAGLGYLSGGAKLRAAYGPGDDPKRLVDLDRQMQEIVGLYQQGKLPEALRLARSVMKLRPTMPVLYEFLSYLEDQDGRAAAPSPFSRKPDGAAISKNGSRPGWGFSTASSGSRAGRLRCSSPFADPPIPTYGMRSESRGRTPGSRSGPSRPWSRPCGSIRRSAVAWQNIELTRVHANRPQKRSPRSTGRSRWRSASPGLNGRRAALEELGRRGEALESWRRALELDRSSSRRSWTSASSRWSRGIGPRREALTRFAATAPPALFARDMERTRRLLRSDNSVPVPSDRPERKPFRPDPLQAGRGVGTSFRLEQKEAHTRPRQVVATAFLAASLALAASRASRLNREPRFWQFGRVLWDSDSGLPQNSVDRFSGPATATSGSGQGKGSSDRRRAIPDLRFTHDARDAGRLGPFPLRARDGTLWVGTRGPPARQ